MQTCWPRFGNRRLWPVGARSEDPPGIRGAPMSREVWAMWLPILLKLEGSVLLQSAEPVPLALEADLYVLVESEIIN